MWLSALIDTTGQYLEVVMVGLILGPAAAGVYFVATRITNVFAMITGSIGVYATSQISALFYSGAKLELQSMLRALAIIGAILNGAALLVIIVGRQAAAVGIRRRLRLGLSRADRAGDRSLDRRAGRPGRARPAADRA